MNDIKKEGIVLEGGVNSMEGPLLFKVLLRSRFFSKVMSVVMIKQMI